MSRLPYDEWLALHTVARETIDRPEQPELGSPGYGHPTALTSHLVNMGQVDLVFSAEEPGVYRARLTPAGKRVLLAERARLDAED